MIDLKSVIIRNRVVLTTSFILLTSLVIQLFLIHYGLLPIPILNADPGANPEPW